ncbi:hypothetical protein [Pseudarthrobacter enclensis]|uniref:hypothetical protein n=1 Tax=Pseudarthrobacter enclensis TaxID=993070 RepID=UPI003EE12351
MAHPKTTAHPTSAEDPQLRLMLATHIHCGEPMQALHPTTTDSVGPHHSPGPGILTYRCFCGFRFEEKQDQASNPTKKTPNPTR